jgi:hypothetical protein
MNQLVPVTSSVINHKIKIKNQDRMIKKNQKLYGNFRKADFEIFFNPPKWSFKIKIHVDITLK